MRLTHRTLRQYIALVCSLTAVGGISDRVAAQRVEASVQAETNQAETKERPSKPPALDETLVTPRPTPIAPAEAIPLPPEGAAATKPADASPTSTGTASNPTSLSLLSVGIQVGKRPVIDSVRVRGAENGETAIGFDDWLVPFDEVVSALRITVNPLGDGQLELRSPDLLVRIDPKNLKIDSELGLVLRIKDIKQLFGVEAEFDIVRYAIVFIPPSGNRPASRLRQPTTKAAFLEGLPIASPSAVSLSAVSQTTTFSSTPGSGTNLGSTLTALGTLAGGSWYVRTNQADLLNSRSWQLNEAQYFRQTDFSDIVVGSQPTFWQSQSGQQYWGITTVQRSGFTPSRFYSGGFLPQQRLSSSEIGRTVTGEAAPGTLVQLVQGVGDEVIAETIVDSSGIYRFENVPIALGGISNYRVKLYPNGRLTATPEIREANFATLPGQLSQGTSAWIASVGLNRNTSRDNFFGGLSDFRGGAAYRLGVTESLTLGAGVVYDRALMGYSELFFQPTRIPLQIAFAGLMGADGGMKYTANLLYRPSQQWEFRLDADDLSQRFQLDWRALPSIRFRFSGNSREDALAVGMTLSQRFGKLFTFADVNYDTNNRVRWTVSSYLDRWQFINQGSEIFTNTELIYNFNSLSTGSSLQLGYETRNSGNYLASLGWRYRSPARTFDGRNLWELELGYGLNARGSGLIASAATNVLPGIAVRLRYEGVSALSDGSSFRLEVSPSFNLTPRLTPSDPNIDRLRNEGGIFVQPFLDANNNGRLDGNEAVQTEELEALLRVNDLSIRNFTPYLAPTGTFLRLAPGRYRVDLDPAGYPIDWKPSEAAYAVEVSAGGYTSLQIPFTRSYAVTGVVVTRSGQPMGGAKVEAVPTGTGKKVLSVTNGAGVFFLEGLAQGSYNLLVDSQPTQPDVLRIDAKSESLQEVTLQQGR